MARRHAAFWSVGIGSLAAVAVAASHGGPVEATVPPESAVPAAESVETVLRATYSLPTGRGRDLAAFLTANAAPGIDVRLDQDRLTVVAPADAQKALGAFIEKCVRKDSRLEPAPAADTNAPPYSEAPGLVPDYSDPGDFLDAPGTAPQNDLGPYQPVRKKGSALQDGFQPPAGETPFMERD